MRNKLQYAVKSLLAGTALTLCSTGAFAAGAVSVKTTSNWANGNNLLDSGATITTVSTALNKNSYTDNTTTLANSAWGHTGNWWTFDVTTANQIVDIKASVLTGNASVAFTVWAANGAFNGGTVDKTQAGSITGINTPHDFNQVGQLGDAGTQWFTDPSVNPLGGGNLLKTLAYANSGIAHTDPTLNDYGQAISHGLVQVATDNTYFSGAVTGGVGSNYAEAIFNNLAVGWYAVYVGGADSSMTQASTYQLTASTVPLPGAVYLFGSAIAGLIVTSRKKLKLG